LKNNKFIKIKKALFSNNAFFFEIICSFVLSQSNSNFMENPNEHQLNIELSDDVAEGIYSNLAIITHSHSEFILDFVKIMPGVPKAKVKSRIILTPQHAKRLLNALKDNVKKFEENFGDIDDQNPMDLTPFNFGGPTAQA